MTPTRREVLTCFLGAAAASACRHAAPAPVAGELLGPQLTRGHLLREPIVLPTELPTERVRVVVIGAGPAGLSASWRLLRGGLTAPGDVRVLELEDEVGGTSRSGSSPVSRYPWGAHYVPVPSARARSLIALLDEVGVVTGRADDGAPIIAEEVLCRAPEERLYARGFWHEGLYLHEGATEDDLAQHRAFAAEIARWAAFRDEHDRPAFAIPTSLASDDAEVSALDRVSMAAWMDARKLTSPRLRWLVDYGCRDDYGLSLDEASAWAGLFYFSARIGDAGKGSALMTWPEGNGRLVDHLRDKTGDRVRSGVTVVDVAEVADGVRVASRDRDGAWRAIVAEQAIVAVPRFVAQRIVGALRSKPSNLSIDYGSWIVANLHLHDRPVERSGTPFAWDNVIYDSKSLGYVVATHSRGIDRGPTVWTWYCALVGADGQQPATRERLLSTTQREWTDVVLADLHRAHPNLRDVLDRLDVWRWGHAMVRPRVGVRSALQAAKPWTPIGRTHFAHTDLSGIALFEEANDHGVRAAEEALAALGIASRSLRT
ncbi:MAG: flavin monoamine oxidase family protein [Polyangiales bacterium]